MGPAGEPNYLRLPKPGEKLEGLSRSTITELVVPSKVNDFNPPVVSVLIKKRNARRGIRLIEAASFYAYLRRLGEEQALGLNSQSLKPQKAAADETGCTPPSH
jgi:hypothetical protein